MLTYVWVIRNFWSTRERKTHKFKALFWALYYRQWIMVLRASFRKRKINYVFSLHPYLLFMCRLKAYVLKQVSAEFIRDRLVGHYQLLDQSLGREGVSAIHGNGLCLGATEVAGKRVEVILQYIHRMRYEGQVSVKLVYDNEVFYFAHVHFCDGAMWIGGLQGMPSQIDLSRQFTRDSYGLRPHNFIYFMLTLLAEKLNLHAIYAVAGDYHYYQKEEKTLQKIRFNYDEFWRELGGVTTQEGNWVSMPLIYPRKTLADIPAKKRSQYQQRYQLMDKIAVDILSPGVELKLAS